MATNAPSTLCWICGRPNDYRVVEHYRPPGSPMVFGPTDWQMVPHEHTQAEVDAVPVEMAEQVMLGELLHIIQLQELLQILILLELSLH